MDREDIMRELAEEDDLQLLQIKYDTLFSAVFRFFDEMAGVVATTDGPKSKHYFIPEVFATCVGCGKYQSDHWR
jgi:hypothetical protein